MQSARVSILKKKILWNNLRFIEFQYERAFVAMVSEADDGDDNRVDGDGDVDVVVRDDDHRRRYLRHRHLRLLRPQGSNGKNQPRDTFWKITTGNSEGEMKGKMKVEHLSYLKKKNPGLICFQLCLLRSRISALCIRNLAIVILNRFTRPITTSYFASVRPYSGGNQCFMKLV